MRSIDAFRIPTNVPDESIDFVQTFLRSLDFDPFTRRKICSLLQLGNKKDKASQANSIANLILTSDKKQRGYALGIIVSALVKRKKWYFALKYGTVRNRPTLTDPRFLITTRGEEKWYGPIEREDDPESSWYIRPVILNYNILDQVEFASEELTRQRKDFHVRWLCFARVTSNSISLHWRNFTANQGTFFLDNKPYKASFPYWLVIPNLFTEIEGLTNSKLSNVDLESLILDDIWDAYREKKEEFKWEDIHIKAEHRGVSLNARRRAMNVVKNPQTGKEEFDIEGISYLAKTIRRSIQHLLKNKYPNTQIKAEDEKDFDEEILRTIIKEYDPQAYECAIQQLSPADMLFWGKAIFGRKKMGEESLSHISLTEIKKKDDLNQLLFILKHFNPAKHSITTQPRQLGFGLFARED